MTGLVVGALAWVIWLATGWPLPVAWALVGFGLGFVPVWWSGLRGSTLWKVEEWSGLDLNRDKQVGKPDKPGPPPTVRVDVTDSSSGDGIYKSFDLPCDPKRLRVFAQRVLSGVSTAQGGWTGKDGLFSRSEYERLRDELMLRELAVWNNPAAPAQGWALKAVGRVVMRGVLELEVGSDED